LRLCLASLIGTFLVLGWPMVVPSVSSSGLPASWLEVREQTTCEAMQDDYCVGRRGFTIRNDGAFTVGPSDRGTTANGQIRATELKRLQELLAEVSSSLAVQSKTCRSGGLPGVKDQVDITFGNGAVVRVYDLGGRIGMICYAGSWHWVHNFHEFLHGLMVHYYPVPFPKN
jgi:hypothetical protein